jgi:hypothetical protein
VTVHRAHGFRFVIFTNDHAPPHVHVFGQGGEAKIVLEGRGLHWEPLDVDLSVPGLLAGLFGTRAYMDRQRAARAGAATSAAKAAAARRNGAKGGRPRKAAKRA